MKIEFQRLGCQRAPSLFSAESKRMHCAGFLVGLLLGALCASHAANSAEPRDRDPIVKDYLGDRSREDVFKSIEQQQREREQQDAERAARETEVRRLLKDIRERIFELELFFAQRRDGGRGIDCRKVASQRDDLQARIKDAEALQARVAEGCGGPETSGANVRKLCVDQEAALEMQLGKLRQQSEALAAECPSGRGK